MVILASASTSLKYVNHILKPHVFLVNCSSGVFLMSGNARFHSAQKIDRFLRIKIINHPARNPDPNPIQHAWYLLESRLRKIPVQLRSFIVLQDGLLKCWNVDTNKDEIRYYYANTCHSGPTENRWLRAILIKCLRFSRLDFFFYVNLINVKLNINISK